ncbi:hypothetical protein [Caldibacillus phage CBP1]|uniref:Uncharacterized protein n=1 Tax=Caldibacillus debilis GB1 TaxID=1339248 RepID=A0A420VJK0_9BACI|nr:hypothetical protein [Caldibacillus debilis]ATB52723.1 hypothetical protein [Caldibacillus phage CBP1]RKO63247.1 hypothetical protein Cdeb_00339 [Caldibacillus debilis GB1]RKO63548.1 hypothetical protein Cdeb_02811 [Caldibacillus debilis GB1]
MGIFSPKGTKFTADDYIEKYGLNNLSEQEIIRKIAKDLAESGMTKETLSGKANVHLEAQILYLETIVEQNWLILKQLEKLNNNLKHG